MKSFKQYLIENLLLLAYDDNDGPSKDAPFLMENQEDVTDPRIDDPLLDPPELASGYPSRIQYARVQGKQIQRAMEKRTRMSNAYGDDDSRAEIIQGSPMDSQGIVRVNGLEQGARQIAQNFRTLHPYYSSIKAKIRDPLGIRDMGHSFALAKDAVDIETGKKIPSETEIKYFSPKTAEEMTEQDKKDLSALSDEIADLEYRVRVRELYRKRDDKVKPHDPSIA